MKKFHIVVDLAKCVGCFNCMLACKDEHVGNEWLPYTDQQEKHEQKWINPEKIERGEIPYTEVSFVPQMCQHCDNAPCEKKSPDLVKKRDDGIVLIDPIRARGKKELVKACPYGMISWNEELEVAQKCTMCAHLLDNGWKEPRCVQACPLRALSIVHCEDHEFNEMADAQGMRPITDGSNKPLVVYKNLYKYNKCFVAGAMAYMDGDIEMAATDAKVKLLMNGEVLIEQEADFLGEFKIDKIPQNSGTFTLEYELDGYKSVKKDVTIEEESLNLGCVVFS